MNNLEGKMSQQIYPCLPPPAVICKKNILWIINKVEQMANSADVFFQLLLFGSIVITGSAYIL